MRLDGYMPRRWKATVETALRQEAVSRAQREVAVAETAWARDRSEVGVQAGPVAYGV